MLSKNRVGFIISLQKKKTRDEQNLFVIEGDKLVKEFIDAGMHIEILIAKPEFIGSLSKSALLSVNNVESVNYEELKQISNLKTPHNALAVVSMPELETDPEKITDELCAGLDFIQDPGNLGTIIRAAAWFGIKNIVCSENCVDVYNPKVIQATMGAIMHVKVHYFNLEEFLKIASERNIPIYGTLLDGESIYNQKLGNKGVILLGNESKGISDNLLPYITERIMIPKFSKDVKGIESLNAGMAASVVFSEFARRIDSGK
jgi:TrmH family RNA methyltransferase